MNASTGQTMSHAQVDVVPRDDPGTPWPLGAHPDASGGTRFALFAPDASRVELCLFDSNGTVERERVDLPACSDGVWHGRFAAVPVGTIYGYRVHGAWDPSSGHRFNPAKVLLDPYAREIIGRYSGSDLFRDALPDDASRPDQRDNAALALKARVCDRMPALDESAHCRVPRERTVLYEAHVRSLTRLHPEIPAALRGTYAGMTHPAVLEHLHQLGVTTLSLMPLMQRVDEPRLLALGLTNHWGYNTIGWFCAEPRFWSGRAGTSPLSECREMVCGLHAAGFEVVVDVVFNHSAESDLEGPTLSLRGLANRVYYHHRPQEPGTYENWSGCGNCLDLTQPRVLQLVMDSMRHWVDALGVDGFRFDLAPILGRDAHGFRERAAFLAALRQDPSLARTKLIAEPWDIGPGGHCLGRFPAGWLEWNDRYRDTIRQFWLRGTATPAAFVDAIAGSSAVFAGAGRAASSSVNFVSAHDGYTLHDLVSYEQKHNEANGEHNRDGHGDNHGTNCGVEGESDDAGVLQRRRRLQRALLATVCLSVGTPQLLAGDEVGHSQQGNNNAYCQDNAIAWIDWARADVGLARFVAACLRMRANEPLLQRDGWLGNADVSWLGADGRPLHGDAWHDLAVRSVGVLWVDTTADGMPTPRRLLLFNAAARDVEFALPELSAASWDVVLRSDRDPEGAIAASTLVVGAESVAVVEVRRP